LTAGSHPALAPYRRGFQHGAAALLQLVASKLDPVDARQLAAWAGAELGDWRIVGHEAADSPSPPPPPEFWHEATE
jgi:hypothetical protein